jgi:hypothetical protein
VYKINGNTEKEIRTKQTNKKKSSNDFFYFNFPSFIKKNKTSKISSFTNHTSTNNHPINIRNNLAEKKTKPPYIIFDSLVNICRKIAQMKNKNE